MIIKRSNKLFWVVLLSFLILVVAFFVYQKNSTRQKPVAECVNTGATSLVPLGLHEMLKESPIVITGAIKQENKNDGYTVLVSEQHKGDIFKKNEKIALCTTMVSADAEQSYESSLIFIRGFDKRLNSWVTTQGYLGTVPSEKSGTYEVDAKSYSLDEIRQAINERK